MTDTEVSYAAGFFDGEGCILVSRRMDKRRPHSPPDYWLVVQITNNVEAPLQTLRSIFGGAVYRWDKRYSAKRKHVLFDWRLIGQDAERFLRAVQPHLIIKRTQADLAVAFMRDTIGMKRRAATPELLALREGYYLALQEAKRQLGELLVD